MPPAEIIAALMPTPSAAAQGRPGGAQDVAGFAEALLQAAGPGRLRRPTEVEGAEALAAAAAAGPAQAVVAATPLTPPTATAQPVPAAAAAAASGAAGSAPAAAERPGFLAAPPPGVPTAAATPAAAPAPGASRLTPPPATVAATGGEAAVTAEASSEAPVPAATGGGPAISPGGLPATPIEKAAPSPAVATPAAPPAASEAAAVATVQPEVLSRLGQNRQAAAAAALGAAARMETTRPAAPAAQPPVPEPIVAAEAAPEGEGPDPILPPISLAHAAGGRPKAGLAANSPAQTATGAAPAAPAGGQTAAATATPAQPAPVARVEAAAPAAEPPPPLPVAPGGAPAPTVAAPASPAATSQAAAHAPVEAVAQIAAQIVRRLEGRTTRFDMQLNPAELGRVDVRLEIDAEGRLAARLAFENPAAAADLRGRVDELRRGLEDSGFQLADDAFSFADREQQERRQPPAWTHRAFAEGAETAERADLAAAPVVRLAAATGLDVRI